MKKILTIILLTSTILFATSCSSSNIVTNATGTEKEQTMFEWNKVRGDYYILVDKETGVCYLVYDGYGDYSTEIIVLLNADGTPKIWED